MNEKLLQFIWQFQYFNNDQSFTTQGELLSIEKPGRLNTHQGPDFAEAIIRIGNTLWAGNIELHYLSSHWHKHRHSSDKQYDNIILHVVWEDDSPVIDSNGFPFPTFELKSRVPSVLLQKFQLMMSSPQTVPCYTFLPALNDLEWLAWKERLMAERLERSATHISNLYKQSGNSWEETTWWLVAANFGGKVNGILFEELAKSIPFYILLRHHHRIQDLEAILMGQAHLLHKDFTEDYPRFLQTEYRFLSKKYALPIVNRQPAFLRMRPAGFPSIRLAQLAMLLHQHKQLFADIISMQSLKEVLKFLQVKPSAYWQDHYCLDEVSAIHSASIGKAKKENIIINTLVPLLFTYGKLTNNELYKNRAISWLLELKPEENQVVNQWKSLGIIQQTALDSQAMLELTNQYCLLKKCLQCGVGNKILQNNV